MIGKEGDLGFDCFSYFPDKKTCLVFPLLLIFFPSWPLSTLWWMKVTNRDMRNSNCSCENGC